MTFSTFLGLDLGTSSLKAVLADPTGKVLAEASADYPTHRPCIGWTEQDPADWCNAMSAVVADLHATAPAAMGGLAAISFCSAAHLPVLLDSDSQVIRPAILWSDQRSTAEVAELKRHGVQSIYDATLNEPSCTWTLPQLMWVARHEPRVMARATVLLSSKDYLIHLLTDALQMDVTSAVATLMYNPTRREWAADLVKRAGLPLSAMPQVCDSATIVGYVGAGRKSFGLPFGIPVISGALDSAAEIVACTGRMRNMPAVIRVGSSAAILAPGTNLLKPGLLNYPHAIFPGCYYQAGTNAGAVALQWARQMAGGLDHAQVDLAVSGTPEGAAGLLFHPYLQGERAPFWNPDLRGSFSGIHSTHNWGHFLRAVMEGVAFSLRDCLERLSVHLPPDKAARLAGGVTRGKVWPQILADVLDRPLETVEHAESALGAAFIAMKALGGEAAVPSVSVKTILRPRPEVYWTYRNAFVRYGRWSDFMDMESRMPIVEQDRPLELSLEQP